MPRERGMALHRSRAEAKPKEKSGRISSRRSAPRLRQKEIAEAVNGAASGSSGDDDVSSLGGRDGRFFDFWLGEGQCAEAIHKSLYLCIF